MKIQPEGHPVSVYEAVGGDATGVAFFEQLVEYFYTGVDADSRIRHMYPEDLADSKRWMAGFLVQYFGGPGTYSEQRGHPRLRMRHAPFVIGEAEKAAWLESMHSAIATMDPVPAVRRAMEDYFEMAATHMINAPSPHGGNGP